LLPWEKIQFDVNEIITGAQPKAAEITLAYMAQGGYHTPIMWAATLSIKYRRLHCKFMPRAHQGLLCHIDHFLYKATP
jgi:hypothetical protein